MEYHVHDNYLTNFHSQEYITVHARGADVHTSELNEYHREKPYEGVLEHGRICAGSTLAAREITENNKMYAINFNGGHHQSYKSTSSGFYFINDIVLGVQELLLTFENVMIIDVDYHHGDGVQSYFYGTDRVVCISYHCFGEEIFPNSGTQQELGRDKGKYFNLNVPFASGLTDKGFKKAFETVSPAAFKSLRSAG
jgi:histone deacetylase 1/2